MHYIGQHVCTDSVMGVAAVATYACRAASHDRCSWVLEWEGFDAQHRPGWLHPAVYLLTAAYYSYDMECRRLKRKSDTRQHLQEWVLDLTGQAAWALDRTWSTCKSLAQKLQEVWAASPK